MNRIHTVIPAMFVCACVLAQNSNLNPTVQVTNTYENKLRDIDRTAESAAIPDSLYKFDLNFDYVGFENPYKGSDEFNPFLTDLDIASRKLDNKRFYLKAGAGYSLHPVFDLAWTFSQKERFKMGLYANHKSYFGNYWTMEPNEENRLVDRNGDSYGFNAASKAGLDARVDWDACRLLINANYDGRHAKMPDALGLVCRQRSYNAGGITLDFASTPDMQTDYWRFSARTAYTFSHDNRFCDDALIEHNLDIDLACAYDFVNGHSIEVDADATAAFNSSYTAAGVVVKPRYMYSADRFTIAVGAGLLFTGTRNVNRGKSPFDVFPSLRLEWNAVPRWLDVFVNADISSRMYGARAQALEDGFYIPDTQLSIVKTRTVDAGIRGCLFDKLQYKLTAAFDMAENMPLYLASPGTGQEIALVHENLNNGRFAIELNGTFGGFSIGANACYRLYVKPSDHKVVPPSLTAGVDMRYSVRGRIIPYVGFKYTNNSVSNGYTVPYFFDLYAGAECKCTRKFSIFLSGANLLNQRQQYIPMIAERGVSVTAGIVLNF